MHLFRRKRSHQLKSIWLTTISMDRLMTDIKFNILSLLDKLNWGVGNFQNQNQETWPLHIFLDIVKFYYAQKFYSNFSFNTAQKLSPVDYNKRNINKLCIIVICYHYSNFDSQTGDHFQVQIT